MALLYGVLRLCQSAKVPWPGIRRSPGEARGNLEHLRIEVQHPPSRHPVSQSASPTCAPNRPNQPSGLVNKPPLSSRKPGVGPAVAKISLFRPKPSFSSRKHESGPVVRLIVLQRKRAAPPFPSPRVPSPSSSPTCAPNRPSAPLLHLRSKQTPFLEPKTWGWAS